MNIFSLMLVFAAFSPQSPPGNPELIRPILEFVQDELQRQGVSDRWRGPLIFDINSFISAVRKAEGIALSETAVAAAINQEFRTGAKGDAVRCASSPDSNLSRNCWIVDRGLFIEIDSMSRTKSGYSVTLTYLVSDDWRRGGQRSAIFSQTVLLSFVREGGSWRVQRVLTLRTS